MGSTRSREVQKDALATSTFHNKLLVQLRRSAATALTDVVLFPYRLVPAGERFKMRGLGTPLFCVSEGSEGRGQ